MKCLLTGGNAFVSKAIGPALASAGHELTVGIRAGHDTPEWTAGLSGTVTIRAVDLARETGLLELVAGHDIIVHNAGRIENPALPAAIFQRDNILVTRALIDAAIQAGCAKIINFSSMSIYGSINSAIVDEATGSREPTPYGASKLAAEEALREAAPELASISLRAPGIVGPHAHGNWLARSRDAFRTGAPVTISNPNFSFNNAVHVDDLARFVTALCARDWSGFNAFPIGADPAMTVRSLIRRLQAATASKSPITVVDGTRRPFAISSEFAIREFGYEPASMADIIDRFAVEP